MPQFQTISVELLIREAFERIGISSSQLVLTQLQAALTSINFLLTEWSNRNVNLWMLKTNFLALSPGVESYVLPGQVDKVIQAQLRTSTRQLNGVPSSWNENGTEDGGGNPEYAFDGNPLTSCLQEKYKGFIQYFYPEPQIINFLGLQFKIDQNYNNYELSFDASFSHEGPWITLASITEKFETGIIKWFNVNNATAYKYYRIRALNFNYLNLQEIYFNNNIFDSSITEISRYTYLTLPQKYQIGRPTIFYVDYQIQPQLYLWQVPSNNFNCLMYSAQYMIDKVTSYVQELPIPAYFYQPLVFGLAYHLAIKYNPQVAADMDAKYQQSMQAAIVDNSSTVPLTIIPYGEN